METKIIVIGLALFCFCMSLHLAIWRIGVPRVSSLVLILILLGIPGTVVTLLLARVGDLREYLAISPVELLEIFLLHFSLSSAYIATYPAVRAVSPTLDILLMIRSAKDGKMTKEEIESRYTDLRLVGSRIDDLMEYRLINHRDGRFTIKPIARTVLSAFIFYRRLLGLPMGRG